MALPTLSRTLIAILSLLAACLATPAVSHAASEKPSKCLMRFQGGAYSDGSGRLSETVQCPGATSAKMRLSAGGVTSKWLRARRTINVEDRTTVFNVVLAVRPGDTLGPLVAAAPHSLSVLVSACNVHGCRRTHLGHHADAALPPRVPAPKGAER